MKKFFLLILFIIIPLNVYARSITIMDMDTKRELYSENKNEVRLIASISKIMTSFVTINNININNIVTIDKDVLKSFGSGIYVEVGEKISIENLLYGLMLRSGNDAAIELANKVGGSNDGFILIMNEIAQNLNMKNTKFINPSGLENEDGVGNTSTSYDMALLMSEAMKNETFRKIVNTKERMVKTNYKTYIWHNKNRLLNEYEFCNGGKTGFTEKARRTLVTTASKNGMNFVIVTLNDPNDFSNHKALYEKYFNLYKSYLIINKTKEKFSNNNYYVKNNRRLSLTKDEYKKLEKNIILYKKNISDIVGYIEIKLNNNTLMKEYIYEMM